MDFSHHKSPNPTRVAREEGGIRRRMVRNPSHMEDHTKLNFLAYFTLQVTLIMLKNYAKLKIVKTIWDGFISQLFSTWGESEIGEKVEDKHFRDNPEANW